MIVYGRQKVVIVVKLAKIDLILYLFENGTFERVCRSTVGKKSKQKKKKTYGLILIDIFELLFLLF